MNTKRLMKVVKNLQKPQKEYIGPKKFDFGNINIVEDDVTKNQCGSSGCAIGSFPLLFSKHWFYDVDGLPELIIPHLDDGIFNNESYFFDITDNESLELFYPGDDYPAPWNDFVLGNKATKKQVARGILNFIEWKKRQK